MTSSSTSEATEMEESLLTLRNHLAKAGLDSIKDLVARGPVGISQATGLNFEDAVQFYSKATAKLKEQRIASKYFQTAAKFYDNRRTILGWISTGSKNLDKLFGSTGIEIGAVTEFYGASGTGKTQICNTLSIIVQQNKPNGGLDGKALYIDTENKFRPERLAEIAKTRGFDSNKTLENIILASPQNTLEQELTIEESESIIKAENIKLVIVDSVIKHYRVEFQGRSVLSERQQRLNKFMHQLSRIAVAHRIAVVVTNQVHSHPDWIFADGSGHSCLPLGGNIMAHASTYRISLRHSGSNRLAKIVDSSYHAENEARFRISEKGIEDI